jgi:cleavage and polyadenylation specificity factor subunit 1
MPFGLRNAASTFQRFMDYTLRGLPGVEVYIDDILISANTFDEHVHRLESVLHRLSKAGLRVNAQKSIWCRDEVDYLGFHLTPEGYRPIHSRVTTIQQSASPNTAGQLRRTLGMLNFYRHHIPSFAKEAAPLYDRLKNFVWSNTDENRLRSLKNELAQATLLTQPRTGVPFTLHTDASGQAIGATLAQEGRPLAFFSAKLSPCEQRYSTFDKEAFAIVRAVKAYRHWLEGQHVEVFTDHQPLTAFLAMKQPSARQAKWATFLAEFDLHIHYIRGRDNVAADHLSRPPLQQQGAKQKVTAVQIALDSEHQWYPKLTAFDPTRDAPVSEGLLLQQREGIWYECSTGKARLFLPPELRREAFDLTHNVAHPGSKKTGLLLAARFFWPNMKKQIKEWVKCCPVCQASKVTRHLHHEHWHEAVHARFQVVHVDIVGPLPVSRRGSAYMLTMVDRFSRWVEAVPIKNITARNCAEVFLANWVARFGVPEVVVSDQGRQFESSLFNELLQLLGIKRARTTPYHPQTNALVERSHRTIKNALRAVCTTASEWEDKLPLVLLSLRTTTVEPTQVPPCRLVLGANIRLPVDLLVGNTENPRLVPNQNDVCEQALQVVEETSKWVDQQQQPTSHPPVKPLTGWVWLRDDRPMRSTLAKPYEGPYKVIEQRGPVVTIRYGSQEYRVNYDRLKPMLQLNERACAEAGNRAEAALPGGNLSEEEVLEPEEMHAPQALDESATHEILPISNVPTGSQGPILTPFDNTPPVEPANAVPAGANIPKSRYGRTYTFLKDPNKLV